jgi:hypothetical protein
MNSHYLDDDSCALWTERCAVLSSKSIENHLSQAPLNQLVALGHFFSQQKKKKKKNLYYKLTKNTILQFNYYTKYPKKNLKMNAKQKKINWMS